jgi:hypothetical protein
MEPFEAFLIFFIALPALLSSLGYLFQRKYALGAVSGCFFGFSLTLVAQSSKEYVPGTWIYVIASPLQLLFLIIMAICAYNRVFKKKSN